MITDKKKEMTAAKDRVRRRINSDFDRSKYKYIPEEKPVDFYDNDVEQRVGIYVRVSTDDIRQTTSFELQRKYYEDFVDKPPIGNSLRFMRMRVSPAPLPKSVMRLIKWLPMPRLINLT